MTLLLLIPALADGQQFRTYAGEFLQLGVSARNEALGGAGVGFGMDAAVGYWNPARLSQLEYPTISGMHEARFDNTVQYNFGAASMPVGMRGGASITLLQIGINNIKDTRSAWLDVNQNGRLDEEDRINYDKVSTFGNSDWVGLLSYGQSLDSMLSVGASAKFIYRKLDADNSGIGIGFDLALSYRLLPELSLGANLLDGTTTLISYTSGAKELVSPTLRLGAAYSLTLWDDHRVMPVIDADLRFENRGSVAAAHLGGVSIDPHFGLEYSYKSTFAIRGGYNDVGTFSVGAGVHLPKLNVDYAFRPGAALQQLGSLHRISFTFTFEQDKLRRRTQ